MECSTYLQVFIIGAGNKSTVQAVGENLSEMEERKGFTFSVDKSNYMIVKTGKGRRTEDNVEIEVKRGHIKREKEYKYLGNWLTEDGTLEKQIKEAERKAMGIVPEIRKIGREENTGALSVEVQLLIYERISLPSILYNIEMWTGIRKKDWENLERVQGMVLRTILKLPKSTPYWGLIKETGMWPLQEKVIERKDERVFRHNERR